MKKETAGCLASVFALIVVIIICPVLYTSLDGLQDIF